MEGGTLLGIEIAGTAAALVVAGAVVGRSGRAARGRLSVIVPSLGVTVIAAVCGVVLVGAGTDAYLAATTPDCSQDESHPTLVCLDPGDRGKKAGAAGLLGGLVAG